MPSYAHQQFLLKTGEMNVCLNDRLKRVANSVTIPLTLWECYYQNKEWGIGETNREALGRRRRGKLHDAMSSYVDKRKLFGI